MGDGGGGCGVAPARSAPGGWLSVAVAALAATALRRRRWRARS